MHAAALDWTKILVALIGLAGIVLGALIGLIQTRAARLERSLRDLLTNDKLSADVWNNGIVGKISQDQALRGKFVDLFVAQVLSTELVIEKIRSIAQDTSKAATPLSERESQLVAEQLSHFFETQSSDPMLTPGDGN